MIDFKKELNNDDLKPNKEVDLKKRRLNNKINGFLNSYFKFAVVALVAIFFIVSVNYIIIPRFKKVSVSSEEVLQSKKAEFLREYNSLQNYKKIIASFSQINEEDVYKIEKMMPNRYSREDLFIEITHFLLENNFKTDLVKISDPLEVAPVEKNDAQGRRTTNNNIELPGYYNYAVSLPSGVGSWLAEVELSETNYASLKQFLNIIENNLRIMDIYSLDFDPQTKTIKAKIITYYKKN
jgi:Tfp pilus assembly protein PilO